MEPHLVDKAPVVRSPNAHEIERKRSLKKALVLCRTQFLLAEPFTASLAMRLNLVPVVDTRVPTACTDGESIFFSVPFCEQLSDRERYFLIAHEVWHCAAGHFGRRHERMERLWNIAVDHEVNAILKRFGVKIPKDAVYFKRYDKRNAEQVYELLLKAASQQAEGRGMNQSRFKSFDLHDLPYAARTPDSHTEQIVDSDFAPVTFSEDRRREWQQRLAAARHEYHARFGRVPGQISQTVAQFLSPTVPWQQLMRQFLQRCYGGAASWLPPARRHLYRGLYLPSRRSRALSIAVAIDTSGSTQDALAQFMSEVRSLLAEFDRVEITLICCDTKVQSVEHFTDQDLGRFEAISLPGGGGTDFRPAFNHVEEHNLDISCLVYLTDGAGEAPKDPPRFPVLWVLTEEGRKPTPWGETTTITQPLSLEET